MLGSRRAPSRSGCFRGINGVRAEGPTPSPTRALRPCIRRSSWPTPMARRRRSFIPTPLRSGMPPSRGTAPGLSSLRRRADRPTSTAHERMARACERLTDDPAFDDQAALVARRTLARVRLHAQRARGDLAARPENETAPQPHESCRWALPTRVVARWAVARVFLRSRFAEAETAGWLRDDPAHGDLSHARGRLELRQLTHMDSLRRQPELFRRRQADRVLHGELQDVIAISDPRRQRATTQIAVIDVAGGTPRMVTSGKGEKWSPRWVTSDVDRLCQRRPESGLEFALGAVYGRTRRVQQSGVVVGRSTHAVPSRHRAELADRDGNAESRSALPSAARGLFPSFSPSGDRVAFTTGFSALPAQRPDGHQPRRHRTAGSSTDDLAHNTVAPSWSPRGDLIAFGSGGAFAGFLGQNAQQISNIAVVAPDGNGFPAADEDRGQQALSELVARWPSHCLPATGCARQGAAYSRRRHAVQVTVLTDGNGNKDNFPTWSPKGDEISSRAIAKTATGRSMRFIRTAPGFDASLTFPATMRIRPWSPDGQWLAFATGATGFKDEMALHPHNPQSYGEIAGDAAGWVGPSHPHRQSLEDATPRWAPMP